MLLLCIVFRAFSWVQAKGWYDDFVVAYPLPGAAGTIRFIPGNYFTTSEGFDFDWNAAAEYKLKNTTCTGNIELLHMAFVGVVIEGDVCSEWTEWLE